MSDGIHQVVVYVHEGAKGFSITARMARARLSEVDDQMAAEGFSRKVVRDGMTKEEAEDLRDEVYSRYIADGYTYQPREPLS